MCLYKMITCPIDIKDKKVVDLWNHYCCTYTADVSLERPVLYREKKEVSSSMRRTINSWICIIKFTSHAESDRGRLASQRT